MSSEQEIPEDYKRFTIDEVERIKDSLILRYGGKIFGGVMAQLLDENVLAAIQPGAELIVRYHTAETGQPGQVAHMVIRHSSLDGWAEIYADWE